jgi:1-acyl-sn-glycerol-3-phosphate acyltransferase
MPSLLRIIKPSIDLGVTLLLWVYYILGYVVLFSPFYVVAFFFARNRESAFQKLNHLFHKSFFMLVQAITPGLSIRVDQSIRSIRSSVVVCNHLSYLDPILLVSLFERQKTIVKSRFFKFPVFGWILRESGYIPSAMDQEFSPLMMERLGGISDFLSSGGNLFIFPEGHRSREGKLGPLNKGAFTIAKRCRAPIAVLMVRNTERLFIPGKFLFNTCIPNTIEVELIGQIHPDGDRENYSISGMMDQASFLFANKLQLT